MCMEMPAIEYGVLPSSVPVTWLLLLPFFLKTICSTLQSCAVFMTSPAMSFGICFTCSTGQGESFTCSAVQCMEQGRAVAASGQCIGARVHLHAGQSIGQVL